MLGRSDPKLADGLAVGVPHDLVLELATAPDATHLNEPSSAYA
jgi:hypothetical protein